jgi:hypothetical protein
LEWPDSDREKILTHLIEKKLACPDCGTREDEWNPQKGGLLHAYHTERFTCRNCANIEGAYADARFMDGKKKGQLPPGLKIRLVPNYLWLEKKRLKRQREAQAKIANAKDGNLTNNG